MGLDERPMVLKTTDGFTTTWQLLSTQTTTVHATAVNGGPVGIAVYDYAEAAPGVRTATERGRRAEALYDLTHALADARTAQALADVAGERLWLLLRLDVCLFLVDTVDSTEATDKKEIKTSFNELKIFARRGDIWGERGEEVTARWSFDQGQAAGLGTDNLPGAEGLYIPLVGTRQTWGVLGLRATDVNFLSDPSKKNILYALARAIASAVERVRVELPVE